MLVAAHVEQRNEQLRDGTICATWFIVVGIVVIFIVGGGVNWESEHILQFKLVPTTDCNATSAQSNQVRQLKQALFSLDSG